MILSLNTVLGVNVMVTLLLFNLLVIVCGGFLLLYLVQFASLGCCNGAHQNSNLAERNLVQDMAVLLEDEEYEEAGNNGAGEGKEDKPKSNGAADGRVSSTGFANTTWI